MTAAKVTEPNVPTLLDVLEKLGAKTLEVKHLRAINAELLAALEEHLAASDALTAFLLASDPKVMGEKEWRTGHAERSKRRTNSILAARAAIAKAKGETP